MSQIVGGKKYNTEKATLVASNEYWDGRNWERRGRNKHLYKTPKGAFFVLYSSLNAGERNYIEPVGEDEAKWLYEILPEHGISYEEAFGEDPEEA